MANITIGAADTNGRRLLTIKQGTSVTLALTPKDADDELIDTTGYKLAVQFRKSFDAASALLTFTTEDDSIENDIANSRFILSIAPEQTSEIRFKGESLEGVYDFELTDPDGVVVRWMEGDFALEREVTSV